MCHEVVDMAQRVRESVFVRISRRLRSMRHRGAFVALCVLLVAAVAGLAVAGATFASGESFTIERSQRAEETARQVEPLATSLLGRPSRTLPSQMIRSSLMWMAL